MRHFPWRQEIPEVIATPLFGCARDSRPAVLVLKAPSISIEPRFCRSVSDERRDEIVLMTLATRNPSIPAWLGAAAPASPHSGSRVCDLHLATYGSRKSITRTSAAMDWALRPMASGGTVRAVRRVRPDGLATLRVASSESRRIASNRLLFAGGVAAQHDREGQKVDRGSQGLRSRRFREAGQHRGGPFSRYLDPGAR